MVRQQQMRSSHKINAKDTGFKRDWDAILKSNGLPATIKGLHAFILLGRGKLKDRMCEIRSIEKLDLYDVRPIALSLAQNLAEMLIDAQMELGKMLKNCRSSQARTTDGKFNIGKVLPPGITKKESHYAQQIAAHPQIVKKTKVEAREKGGIITERTVLRIIHAVNYSENRKNSPLKKGPLETRKKRDGAQRQR
jgi:hypothetical protein